MNVAFVVISILLVYFLPTIIAMNRSHRNTMAIVILNLAGGWTVAGWIAALVWSCTSQRSEVAR